MYVMASLDPSLESATSRIEGREGLGRGVEGGGELQEQHGPSFRLNSSRA